MKKLTPEQEKGQHGGAPDTVRIKADNEDGYAVINESDFDEKTMEKFEGKPTKQKK